MGTYFMKLLRMSALALLLLTATAFAEPKKVVIFYSSIGMGHKSAAEAIQKNLVAKDPTVVVELKNIRDFMPKWRASLDEWLFWTVVKKAPDRFDQMFNSKMDQGRARFQFVDGLTKNYSQEQMIEYLEQQKPTHILTTHYGSTEALIRLRKAGHYKNTPVGWLHTDYFTGYFPRISQNIDMTFLGIDALENEWAKHGLDSSKVATTGLPINPQIFESFDQESFMNEKGLKPDVKTVVLMSGGEGVGNFPLIVESIVKRIGNEPLQLVTICGKNEEHFKALTEMKAKLPSNIDLRVLGFTKNDEVIKYIKSSNLYITKSGGLSPTEGFAINKPIVLLDVYGGHERHNANLFENLGLAVVNRDQNTIGRDVVALLNSPEKQKSMLEKQAEFKAKYNMDKITDFVLTRETSAQADSKAVGVENGIAVKNFDKALSSMDRDFPADVEIILSYGKSDLQKRFKGDTNPFGHLAIKIDGTVYTLNGRATPGVEPELVHKTQLATYLYSVERFVTNMEHTDAFGNSYARDNISIKVQGVTQEQKEKMKEYIAQVDERFVKEGIGYNKKTFNCADLVKNILERGGLVTGAKPRSPTFPLDVLTDYKNLFEGDARFKTEMVHYQYVPNSENFYKPLRFPLSPYQGLRTVKALVKPESLDPFERLIGKRVAVGMDNNVYYDNVSNYSAAENKDALEKTQAAQDSRLKFFENYEKMLDTLDGHIKQFKFDSEQIQKDLQIISKEYTVTEMSDVINSSINAKTFPDADKRERAVKLQAGFAEWERLQTTYQKKMDEYIKNEMDYLIIGTQTLIKVLFEEMKVTFPNEKLVEVAAALKSAEGAYKTYIANRENIGVPLDGVNRTFPFRKFFGEAKTVIDAYNQLTGRQVTSQAEVVTWKTKAKRMFSFATALGKMSPQVVKLVFAVFGKDRSSEGKTPLSTGISETFKSLARAFGVTTKVAGVEGLQELVKANPLGTKTVNIIAPNHSHPIYDAILMASLNLPHHLLVMATDQIVPGKIGNRMDTNKSIVTVGRGSDLPIQKIIAELERGVSNNIMIYPEGSIASGLYDTRPAREKFAHGLVRQLVERGYKVNIVPVSYKNASRFLNENSISEFFKRSASGDKYGAGTVLEATVSPAIPTEVVDAIVKSGKYNLLNTYLRQHWLAELGTMPNTMNGLLRSQDLIKKFNEQFGINIRNLKANINSCMGFYSK
jgi:processive 1,2-diacylglycerol beta-glucosyltransferase